MTHQWSWRRQCKLPKKSFRKRRCPIAIESFIAGAYTTSYNAVNVGMTSEGFTLTQDAKAELIQNSDQYGDSILDGIYRGGNCFIDFESKVYKAGSMTPWWPYGALGVMCTAAAPIGRQLSAIAAALVMTVVPATPAVSTTPQINTFTASKAILPPDSNLKLLFTSKLRTVPIRLLLLPSDTGANPPGTTTWWIPS